MTRKLPTEFTEEELVQLEELARTMSALSVDDFVRVAIETYKIIDGVYTRGNRLYEVMGDKVVGIFSFGGDESGERKRAPLADVIDLLPYLGKGKPKPKP